MAESVRRGTIRDKGQLTLPAEVRRALHVEAGDDIEFEILPTGQVLMRGMKMIPADQAWFWTESWQRGELQATRDISSGNLETFKDEDAFLEAIQVPEEH